jgi:6-phosphogluconate dehydrogenase
MAAQDFGLIGLAVMGQNLALNIESKGFSVAVYNRTTARTQEFMAERAKGKNFVGPEKLEDFVAALKRPRKIMLMVKAGQPVDDFVEQLLPLLDKGDLIIDGGNSHFPDTIRRNKMLAEKGILYIGTGVSGGEEGALHGPSIMPGGQPQAYQLVESILTTIAAQVDAEPCCTYIGPDGAGHYVKMVHNGIEYGDMQLIVEAYYIMAHALGLSAENLHDVFARWNEGELDSYLIEITRDIFARKDEETGKPMVDIILDRAGQKGTGKWTSQSALDLGIAAPQRHVRRRQGRVHRGHPPGPLRLQDLLLRAGIRSHARGRQGVWLEPEVRPDREDLAGRLYHPSSLPPPHHGGLRAESRSGQPDAGSLLRRCARGVAGEMAPRRRHGH